MGDESLESRLKRFVSTKRVAEEQDDDVEEVIPTGMSTERKRDPLQEKIDKYLNNVPKISGIDSQFAGLPGLTSGAKTISYDFKDKAWYDRPGIILERLPSEKIAEIGRKTIPMMSSGFSPKGAGHVFLLAFQLRDTMDFSPIFEEDDYPAAVDDKAIDDLSEKMLASGRVVESLQPINDVEEEAMAYAYIAASLLRLYTKAESNYVAASQHIISKYQTHYGSAMSVTPPAPTEEALKTLTHYFNRGDYFRVTLYRILYMGGGLKGKSEGLRTFLYEMHLANTGMHIVGIFARLCEVLNCEPGLLLTVINSKEYARQVKALISIIKMAAGEQDEHKRELWVYGRIFEPNYMTPLQTKTCPQLVYALAHALKSEDPRANANILNIVRLKDIGEEKRRRLAAMGEMFVKIIRSHNAGDDPESHCRCRSKCVIENGIRE